YSPTDAGGGCASASSVAVNDTTANDPAIAFTGSRQSFTATDGSNSGWYRIQVTNSSGSTQTYSISASDTTLHNPRWSTFSSFITQYEFRNTSSADINGKLTVTRAGAAPVSITFTV